MVTVQTNKKVDRRLSGTRKKKFNEREGFLSREDQTGGRRLI